MTKWQKNNEGVRHISRAVVECLDTKGWCNDTDCVDRESLRVHIYQTELISGL